MPYDDRPDRASGPTDEGMPHNNPFPGKGNFVKRRTFLQASAAAAALPTSFAIAQPANARTLRFVPQANLTLLDPIFTTAQPTVNHGWAVYDLLFGINGKFQAEAADGGGLHAVRRRPHLPDQAARWAEIPQRRAGAGAGLRAEPEALGGARNDRPDGLAVRRRMRRAGRPHAEDHAEAADRDLHRRDRPRRRLGRLHHAGAHREDRSVQADHRDHRLRPIQIPARRIRRRRPRRL